MKPLFSVNSERAGGAPNDQQNRQAVGNVGRGFPAVSVGYDSDIDSSRTRLTIIRSASGNGLCSVLGSSQGARIHTSRSSWPWRESSPR
jgi:hypothetical protein